MRKYRYSSLLLSAAVTLGLAVPASACTRAEYPEPDHPDNTLSISLWVQYFLDNYATVNEAVQAMQAHPLQVMSDVIPGTDTYTTVHLSISDAGGDNAVF